MPLPMPIALGQRDRRRLVAHVRAVGQVVGAEGPGEQLVDERGLVGRPAGGVEDRLVRARRGRCRWSADQRERVVPGDRLVVGGARAQHHRLGEPALLAEPVVGPRRRARASVCVGEERRGRPGAWWPPRPPPWRRSRRTRRRAVLGVRVGPGAARAVEAVGLVEPEQRVRGAQRAHLADRPVHGDGHGLHPGGRASAVVQVDVERVDVLVRGAPPRFEHAGAPAAVLGHARHAATGEPGRAVCDPVNCTAAPTWRGCRRVR